MAIAQNNYINIDKIAELKGLKNNRTLRIAINKNKYKARKVPVKGGYTYEIEFSTLEPDVQEKLINEEIKSHALIPLNNNAERKSEFKTEKLKVEALAKERVYEIMKPYVKVRKSTLNEDSGLIGAAYLAFSKAE